MLSVTSYRIDGSTTYTQSQYGDMPSPTGDCVLERRTKCDDTGDLHTIVSYDPPQGFSTQATINYYKRGELGLDDKGMLVVIKSPVSQLVVATVTVSYSQAPPAETIQEQDYAPILERQITSYSGGITTREAQYDNFCVTGNAGPVGCTKCDFLGAPVAKIKSVLKGGKCTDDTGVIKIVSDRVVKLGSCEYFRNEVWTYSGGSSSGG